MTHLTSQWWFAEHSGYFSETGRFEFSLQDHFSLRFLSVPCPHNMNEILYLVDQLSGHGIQHPIFLIRLKFERSFVVIF